jgi:hypothetical protein
VTRAERVRREAGFARFVTLAVVLLAPGVAPADPRKVDAVAPA